MGNQAKLNGTDLKATDHATGEIEAQGYAECVPIARALYNDGLEDGAAALPDVTTVRAHYGDSDRFKGAATYDYCYLKARNPQAANPRAFLNPFIDSWDEALAATLAAMFLNYSSDLGQSRAQSRRYQQRSEKATTKAIATATKGEAGDIKRSAVDAFLTRAGFDISWDGDKRVVTYNGRSKTARAALAALAASRPFPVGEYRDTANPNGRGKRAKQTETLICSAGCQHGRGKAAAPVQIAVKIAQLSLWKNTPCQKCLANGRSGIMVLSGSEDGKAARKIADGKRKAVAPKSAKRNAA